MEISYIYNITDRETFCYIIFRYSPQFGAHISLVFISGVVCFTSFTALIALDLNLHHLWIQTCPEPLFVSVCE